MHLGAWSTGEKNNILWTFVNDPRSSFGRGLTALFERRDYLTIFSLYDMIMKRILAVFGKFHRCLRAASTLKFPNIFTMGASKLQWNFLYGPAVSAVLVRTCPGEGERGIFRAKVCDRNGFGATGSEERKDTVPLTRSHISVSFILIFAIKVRFGGLRAGMA